ncbi:MAG: stage III sporulation protein AF [Eisenbergiella sp.]|nr:stage III sporulation protein AF [Bacillota bacterium]
MENFLQLLKDTAVFLLAAQMLMHFLPAKKYEKYGKLMVSLIVLSQLALPILSIGKNDAAGQFWGAFERMEEENEMFSGRLSMLEETGEDAVKSGILRSVEQKVETAAAAASVEVADVRLREDGVVVIEVKREGAGRPVKIEPVKRVAIGDQKTGEASVSAGGNALKGSVRTDLSASFAEALSMQETAVEVVEIE